jgi:CHAT domain
MAVDPGYDELSIRIQRGAEEGVYHVVASGPDGSTGSGPFSAPFTEGELRDLVLLVGRTRNRLRAYRSSGLEEAEAKHEMKEARQEAKRFGAGLFDALITGPVRDVYLGARKIADQGDRGLRVTLYLTDVPELMEIPWELLYAPPSFLAQSMYTPVVRSLDIASVRRPRRVILPLRILGVVSQPRGVEALDVDAEKAKLDDAVRALQEEGLVELRWLPRGSGRTTLSELENVVHSPGDLHVLHYVGHGAYDRGSTSGILVLEDAHGDRQEVTGEDLGTLLQNKRSLRLVVLNSCEGARGSAVDPFSGVAASLAEFDIPAVIGMQFEITDDAAITFSGRLYSAIMQGFSVDAALTQARSAIFAAERDEIEFATPVLFLRSGDARLFDLEQAPTDATPTPIPDVECDLTLTLSYQPLMAYAGQVITWELAIRNTGGCPLHEVTARDPGGRGLAEAAELESGQQKTVRWTELLDPDRRHLITVSARGPDGSWLSEEISASATPPPPPPVPSRISVLAFVGGLLFLVGVVFPWDYKHLVDHRWDGQSWIDLHFGGLLYPPHTGVVTALSALVVAAGALAALLLAQLPRTRTLAAGLLIGFGGLGIAKYLGVLGHAIRYEDTTHGARPESVVVFTAVLAGACLVLVAGILLAREAGRTLTALRSRSSGPAAAILAFGAVLIAAGIVVPFNGGGGNVPVRSVIPDVEAWLWLDPLAVVLAALLLVVLLRRQPAPLAAGILIALGIESVALWLRYLLLPILVRYGQGSFAWGGVLGLLGAALVLGSGVYVWRHESRRDRPQGAGWAASA